MRNVAGRALLVLGVLASSAFLPAVSAGQSAQSSLTDRGQVYIFREVSEALVCQCGCNMILYVCNHVNCPSAIPLRTTIEEKIRAGENKETIIAAFVEEYGEVILSAPTTDGFNLAAWVTPFVMLALGGVFVLSFLGARRRRQAAAVSPGEEAYSDRVKAELDDFERRR